MNSEIHITFGVNEQVRERLDRLRLEFARACNWVVPIAKANHCWNRVALHHLSYHQLRAQFPNLGSQMACNAIYSVCRSYRLLLDHPQSPLFGQKLTEGHLPQLIFLECSPVFFDRHTLSLQNNMLSLFTLEGRLRFGVELNEQDEMRFRTQKLREIQLLASGDQYIMTMLMVDGNVGTVEQELFAPWPDYFVLADQPLKHRDFADGVPAQEVVSIQKAS
jgi:hypothetical protein